MSKALLERMMIHAAAGGVTLRHHVAKGEAQPRAGCQAVADFVEEAAQKESTAANPVGTSGGRESRLGRDAARQIAKLALPVTSNRQTAERRLPCSHPATQVLNQRPLKVGSRLVRKAATPSR